MTPQLSSIDRAAKILDALRLTSEIDIAGTAREIGAAPSTAHRVLKSMERAGLLTQRSRGRYAVGPLIGACAGRFDRNALLVKAGRTPLRRLAADLGCTAHLAVFEDGFVSYLLKIEGPDAAEAPTLEGTGLEAYCSGLGKVLLAHLPEPDLEQYLGRGPLVQLTRNTITDPAELKAELGRVRRQGWALDDEEFQEGLVCRAAPVYWGGEDAIAAVSVSRPAAGASAKRRTKDVQSLRAAASQIVEGCWPRARD
ncbi:MAG: IclR family transcriptional regulator [Pseudomonadota bacterium]